MDKDEVVEEKSQIGIEKLSPTKNINLDLLNSITFKPPKSESSESHESNESEEVSSTTAAVILQPTTLTLVHTSNRTHIIPNADNKTVHVQTQHISHTVFQSTLAILPTISSNNINVPAITATTTTTTRTHTSDAEPHDAVTDKIESSKHLNENKASENTEKLKVKVAEVAANPIILTSQGI